MSEEAATITETAATDSTARIYEIGYTVVPTVKEGDLEKVVGAIRTEIEKAGGNFIAEGAPTSTKLSYEFTERSSPQNQGNKKAVYDRAYFGWIKFEAETSAAGALESALKSNMDILRSIVFQTVREDTRAKMKAPTLREVRRTDTIKSTPRQAATEDSAPVSEVDLEKALKDITTEE